MSYESPSKNTEDLDDGWVAVHHENSLTARALSTTPVCTSNKLLPNRDLLLAAYHQLILSGRRTIHVKGVTGNDCNDGSSSRPFATISRAIKTALPGDRILVYNGVYSYVSVYGFTGNAEAWLSIEAASGHTPVIDVANAAHATGNGLDVQKSSFVGTFGFEIRASQCQHNSDSSGVGTFQNSHHIVHWAHHVHDFPGGGINHFYYEGGWDLVDVSYNLIHDCCKYSVYNTSGVSFYGAVDSTKTTWDGRYGYHATGNYIFNCLCTVPYTPGGKNFVTDGNGISVDSLNTPNNLHPEIVPYTKHGRVDSNVVVGCGGRGIHIYNSINVDLWFNSIIGNMRTDSPAITDSADADAAYDHTPARPNVNYYACVLLPLNTPNTTTAIASYRQCVIAGGRQSVPTGNIDRHNLGVAYFQGKPTEAELIAGIQVEKLRPAQADEICVKGLSLPSYTVLGRSRRPRSDTWAAGAL